MGNGVAVSLLSTPCCSICTQYLSRQNQGCKQLLITGGKHGGCQEDVKMKHGLRCLGVCMGNRGVEPGLQDGTASNVGSGRHYPSQTMRILRG